MTQITAAAIKFFFKGSKYPQIMCGEKHTNIYEKMFQLGIDFNKLIVIEGFWTDDSSFLNRQDAARLAIANGQLRKSSDLYWDLINNVNKDISLYVEDLL